MCQMFLLYQKSAEKWLIYSLNYNVVTYQQECKSSTRENPRAVLPLQLGNND